MEIRKYKRRSYTAERELMKELRRKHIWSWRIPSSGYKTGDYALPDIIGFVNRRVIGFEVKTTEKDHFDITLKDASPIITWLQNSLRFPLEARGFLAVKFIGNNRWKGEEIFNLEKDQERHFEFNRNEARKIKDLLMILHITVNSLTEKD